MNAELSEFRRELDALGVAWKATAASRSPAPLLDVTTVGSAGFVLRVQAYDVADEFVETEKRDVEIAIAAGDEMGRELLEATFSLSQARQALDAVRAIVVEEIAIELDYDADDDWLGSGTVRTAGLHVPEDGEHVSRRSFNGTFDWPKAMEFGERA